MKRWPAWRLFALILIIGSLLTACVSTHSIDSLVTKLSANGLWTNGGVPILQSPANASPEEVVAELFQKYGFAARHFASYRVVQTRQVRIPPGAHDDRYSAVLVATEAGPKIILLQYSPHGWWSKIFDAP
jgi:hypothetical protein